MSKQVGLLNDWDCDTANIYDSRACQTIGDTGFTQKDWHPEHLRICQRGKWHERMIIETTLAMLTLIGLSSK